MLERIDISVRCNLRHDHIAPVEKTHSDSDVVTGSVPGWSAQQSVGIDVWKLDAVAASGGFRRGI